MDNISNVGPKNLYDITSDTIVIDNQEDDLHDLSKSVHIYTKERMIKEKALYISKYEDVTIEDFYKANNIADSMIEILEANSDPDIIIINTVPSDIRLKGDNELANRLTSIYEYLGFRELELDDNIVMIYMNSAGIRIFNVSLDRKEYDYGK